MAIKGVLLFWNAEIKGGFSQMKKNNKKGFTLVELVIVVAVMAVLVAVAIPTISSVLGTAKEAVAESNARTIESVIKLAEAGQANAGQPMSAQIVAQALFDAKLGIAPDKEGNGAEFYYNVTTGAVTATKPGSLDGYSTIKFVDTTGKVTVTRLTESDTDGTATTSETPAAGGDNQQQQQQP